MTLHKARPPRGELAKGLRGDEPAYTLVFNPPMRGEAEYKKVLPIPALDLRPQTFDPAPMTHHSLTSNIQQLTANHAPAASDGASIRI